MPEPSVLVGLVAAVQIALDGVVVPDGLLQLVVGVHVVVIVRIVVGLCLWPRMQMHTHGSGMLTARVPAFSGTAPGVVVGRPVLG